MLAHNYMNKRQKKKAEKNQEPVGKINKTYRKTIKENSFKTQKTTIERQQDFSIKQKLSDKKRVSLYLDLSNYKKILEIQNNHLTQHKTKISKSDAINILLNKIKH
tara:strand:+ start:312 stop:629 length:318 start_codon:yes stop_codon:yes gene_type:complete